ncbi:MAG: hypothetical protein HY963_01715 [Ignavibacteriales bacterium]|nr:hypothetical protein [Ignavibacteriales bacterium]
MKKLLFSFYCISCCLYLFNTSNFGQTPKTAMEAYNYAQNKRSAAQKLFNLEPFSSDSIKKGITILENTIKYLDQPLVVEFANDNRFLRHRKFDVYYDLSIGNALLKNKNESILYLKKMCEEDASAASRASLIQKDSTFDFLRNEVGYKEVINKLIALGNIFENTNLLTSYSYNLSNDEKVAGLTIFWQEVKNNFVYFDHNLNLDWNKTYLTYMSKVVSTKTTLQYYWVLQEMCALLKDSHTNVYPPKELRDSVDSRPPIRTDLIEDKVIITKVLSDSLRRDGIKTGQEIVSIDNVPVKKYAEQNILPYQSSSTIQDLKKRTYGYYLLSGKRDRSIKLVLRDENRLVTETINRSGYNDVVKQPIFEFKKLKNNIAYVALNSFGKDTLVSLFDNSFKEISKSDALIIDLRNNGGGSGNIGFNILGYLVNKEFQISKYKLRASPKDLSWQYYSAQPWKPNGINYYSKPVVVLISNATFSAAEDFCVAFDYMKRGKMIGEQTAGSTGQPYSFSLPGGLTARVCSKRDSYPDGKEFVGIGINPDITVYPTVDDIRLEKDVILLKAIDYLNGILNK